MAKIIHTKGKRKRAVARATLKEGRGIIKINSKLLNVMEPKLVRMKIREPVILAGDTINKVNISVNVFGGGIMSQADAARLAIAKSLVQYNKKLEKTFLDYDRQLLVADVRRKETHKPNSHGKARAKRQKSYR
ncbi:30S ribosomal protein S9 [Candidatus Woesearchaeota archaeon B3_Woes]|nr:MAG: 30S ribosomal protein S9 [Candidatus Woesearchaeota archaeon B3_Woes]